MIMAPIGTHRDALFGGLRRRGLRRQSESRADDPALVRVHARLAVGVTDTRAGRLRPKKAAFVTPPNFAPDGSV